MFTVRHDPLSDDDDRYRVRLIDVATGGGYTFCCDHEYLGVMEDELHRWRNHSTGQRVCMVSQLAVNTDTGHCARHAEHHMAEGHCMTMLTNPPGSLADTLATLSAEAKRHGFVTETHGPDTPPPYTGWQQPWHERLHGAVCNYPEGRCEAIIEMGPCCGFPVRCTQRANHSDPIHRAMYDRCDNWPTRAYGETAYPYKAPDLQGLDGSQMAERHLGWPSTPLGLLPPSTPDSGHSEREAPDGR